MLGSKKNNITPPPTNTPESQEAVYVMPEKFHPHKSQNSSDKTLAIVVIILLLIVVSAGTYFMYDRWQKNQAENAETENQNVAIVNQNINTNINENLNRNSNVNGNENTNDNSNANDNTNENQNNNSNTNENLNTNVSDLVPPLTSGDADKDGLTDLEESLMGTSASSPDSDVDGYLDGEEVRNGYNPIVSSSSDQPIRLIDASFISELNTNFPVDNFKTIYIKGWSVSFIEALHEARIITGTGEMIKISVINNPDQISAANWYLINQPQITLSQLGNLEFGGFKGIRTPNGLAVYLTDQKREKIYAFEYDLDTMAEFRYPTVFEMMIRNFALVSEPINTNTDTNTNPNSTNSTSTDLEI